MEPIFEVEDQTPIGRVTDVIPVLWGAEPIDYIYEINGEFRQRYTTDEINDILDDR